MPGLPEGFQIDQAPSSGGPPHGFVIDEGPSTAGDIVKSTGIGLAKGAVGLAGLPGDAAKALNKGIDWATEKVGLGVAPSQDIATSDQITKAIESKTGKFYEPKTRAGRVAQTAAEFVPGAVLGAPGGMAKNALKFGILPGAASEIAGQATEGSASEPWVRLGTALGVGGIAAVASQPRTAERFIKAQMPAYVTDQAVTRADNMIQSAARSGITLTWPEALSQVTGKPVLNDMQRVMEGAKQTRATMQEAIGQRGEQIAKAGKAEVGNIAPPTATPSMIGPEVGSAAESGLGDIRKAINKASEPYYDAAKTHTLTTQQMNQVEQIPAWKYGLQAVRRDPQLNREVSHLPDNSIGVLNEVKKYLDQAAQNAASPVQQGRSVQRSAGLTKDAQAVRDAAIGSEAAVQQANYAQALHIQEQGRGKFLEPLLQGPLGKLADKDIGTKKAVEALFPAEPIAGSQHEITTAVGALAARNPTAARQLVRAHVEAKLNESFDAAGRSAENAGVAGASFAHQLMGSPVADTQRGQNFRAAVQALPNGKQLWPGIERFLDVVRATGWRQPIGSKTTFNEAELHAMATGKSVANIAKTAASPGEWWHVAHEMWGKWQTGNNLAALAKIITDPRSEAVFRRIVNAPRGNQGAVDMAARLTFAIGEGGRNNLGGTPSRNQGN